ncbi:MAG: hypothetical protein WBE26_06735 [Phycisphaerae bacterium]
MYVSTKTLSATAFIVGLFGGTTVYGQSRTYTTTDDFNNTDNFLHNAEGVSDESDGALAFRTAPETLPYLWVACTERHTVVRIATSTYDPITAREGVQPGDVLGEYWSAPEDCRSTDYPDGPSRTTVDFDGSVWVGNRHDISIDWVYMGHVVKLGSGLVSHRWKNRTWIKDNKSRVLDSSAGTGYTLL